MVYSMTGFGKATFEINHVQYAIEIKSLNSKQTDVFTRVPPIMKELDIHFRKILSEKLVRGKIELSIYSEKQDDNQTLGINTDLLLKYHEQLKVLNIPSNDLLGTLLRLPNVMLASDSSLLETDEKIIYAALEKACHDLLSFRKNEGEALAKDLRLRLSNILSYKEKVKELAPLRVEKIKARMLENLKAIQGEIEINTERFEQELIFYIEKLDVTEEFVRLKTHCLYFEEIMNDEEIAVGRKLNFITQEMGREINTLGSKANDSDIQKWVVQMKDELEKIKEQVNNLL